MELYDGVGKEGDCKFFFFFFFKQEPGLASGSAGELTSDQVPTPAAVCCSAWCRVRQCLHTPYGAARQITALMQNRRAMGRCWQLSKSVSKSGVKSHMLAGDFQ